MLTRTIILLIGLVPCSTFPQDPVSTSERLLNLPGKLLSEVERKANKLNERMNCLAMRQIARLQRQEMRLRKKLHSHDSAFANQLQGDVAGAYQHMKTSWMQREFSIGVDYHPHLDSLATLLKFLDQPHKLMTDSARLLSVLTLIQRSQHQFNNALALQELLGRRLEGITKVFNSSGLTRNFKRFGRLLVVYREQVDEYKRMFSTAGKWESMLFSRVSELPAFQQFFAQHSQLGSLFSLPAGNPSGPDIGGMQTRTALLHHIGEKMGAGINTKNIVGKAMSNALGSVERLQDKLDGSIANGDADMPGAAGDNPRSKTIFKRFSVGINVQSARRNLFLPATTDVGISVGYKVRSTLLAGVGASYKMGWGKHLRHINITHEGLSVRSFIDGKVKSSFWISGGGEFNYRSSFKKIQELKNENAWQLSALLGVCRKIQMKQRSADIRLLYDFFHRHNRPQSEPVIFRIGYNFK